MCGSRKCDQATWKRNTVHHLSSPSIAEFDINNLNSTNLPRVETQNLSQLCILGLYIPGQSRVCMTTISTLLRSNSPTPRPHAHSHRKHRAVANST